MKRWMPILACLVLLLAAAGDASFEWPVPEGWQKETIPFPLEFAPELPYAGVEELRFAPGMFKPGQAGYWSYAFVWWLEGTPPFDAADLQGALRRYFTGLITTVAKDKGFPIDAKRFAASIRPAPRPSGKLGHAVSAFEGTVDAYDGFATGKPITLNVEVWVWDCTKAGKRVALVLASPSPAGDSIWSALHARRSEFACHAATTPVRP